MILRSKKEKHEKKPEHCQTLGCSRMYFLGVLYRFLRGNQLLWKWEAKTGEEIKKKLKESDMIVKTVFDERNIGMNI